MITLPPGVFFQNDIYIYFSDFGGNGQLPTGGELAVGVEGSAAIELPTGIWVLPGEVARGHVGLGATLPVGSEKTEAGLMVAGPLGGVGGGACEGRAATIGWNFEAGDLPISSRVKYFHEFNVARDHAACCLDRAAGAGGTNG